MDSDKVSQNNTPAFATNIEILNNHKYFVESLSGLINVIEKNAKEIDISMDRDRISVDRLKDTCRKLLIGFNVTISNNKRETEEFDQGKIIKKIYKTLTQYTDMVVNEDKNLFTLRNTDGKIVTIIPGLDIGYIIEKSVSDDDMKDIWGHLYVLYITSIKMITIINEHKKNSTAWDAVPILEKKLDEMSKSIFNPFIGFSTGQTSVNVEDIIPHYASQSTGVSLLDPEALLARFGLDKHIAKLNEQLKNVNQEEVDEFAKTFASMLGAENDTDINDVCSSVMNTIVDDLKVTGITTNNIFETARNLSHKITNKVDKDKMMKTAMRIPEAMDKCMDNFNNMKDFNGNPIPKEFMSSMEQPLKMLTAMMKNNPAFKNLGKTNANLHTNNNSKISSIDI